MKYLLICVLILFGGTILFAQSEERLLKVNDTDINVRIIGSGAPILIVHGGPGLNHNYFIPHLKKLASRHRLIFIDQRACGKSSGDLDSTQMSLDLLIRDMEAVRKELKLGKVAVLAHSWGGLLGILYAARYPQSVSSLILSNSISPKQGEYDRQTSELINSRYSKADSALRAQILRSDEFKAGASETYSLLLKISFGQSFYNKDYIDSLNLSLPPDFVQRRKVLFFMSKELSAYNFYPELKKIKCKTLVIHGDYDAIPLELSQKLNKEILHSNLVIVKNAGHFPFIEKNEEFINTVNTFLATVR